MYVSFLILIFNTVIWFKLIYLYLSFRSSNFLTFMVVDNYLFSGKLFENDVYVSIYLYPFEILEQLFAISLLDQVINLFFLFFYLNYYFFLSFFLFCLLLLLQNTPLTKWLYCYKVKLDLNCDVEMTPMFVLQIHVYSSGVMWCH